MPEKQQSYCLLLFKAGTTLVVGIARPLTGDFSGTGLMDTNDRAANYQYGTGFDSQPKHASGNFVFLFLKLTV